MEKVLTTRDDYLNELERYSDDKKQLVLNRWISYWEYDLKQDPNDERTKMLLSVFRDTKRWTVIEEYVLNEAAEQPWQRGIEFHIASFYLQMEAEIHAEEFRKTTERPVEVRWVPPIRKSLDYQGIARRKV